MDKIVENDLISVDPIYDHHHFIIKNPEGFYSINNSFCISLDKKPNIIHRFFTRIFLGWTWEDNKE